MRACATAARTCASPASSSRRSPSRPTPSCSCRRSSTSTDPGAALERFRSLVGERGTVFVSTPNVLTLAPRGASRSDNPWHVHEYRRRGVRRAVPRHFADVEMFGLFHARKLRAHELALRARLGRACTLASASPSASTTGSRPRSRPRTSRCAPRARGRPRSRAGLRRRVPFVSGARRARRAGDRPAHAHALRRGLRHLAVRRGVAVGGDGRLLPAAARAARPAARR